MSKKASERFPDNMIGHVLDLFDQRPDLPKPKTEQESHRSAGGLVALSWILWTYGTKYGIPVDIGVYLGWGGSNPNPKKEDFALLATNVLERLEVRFKFNQRGWARAEHRGSSDNLAYGFYDQLDTIMERFDLHAVAEKARRAR